MKYKIKFEKEAEKEFLDIPKKYQKLIKEKIILLAENPENLKNNIKALKGEKGIYRLRVGDYRVIYHLNNDELVVVILRVSHRKSAYE